MIDWRKNYWVLWGNFLALFFVSIAESKTITFSNMKWHVREGYGAPGPNFWSSDNVWVDQKGWLHLKVTYKKNAWINSGISTETRLGFGHYWLYMIGRLDKLDPNITLALFNYPTQDIGPDKTNEIDIEFGQKGHSEPFSPNTAYIVWPNSQEKGRSMMTFHLDYTGEYTTQGFIWSQRKVQFFSGEGHSPDYNQLIASWDFSPPNPQMQIPQKPLQFYIYFYLYQGNPPVNKNKSFEVIIKQFCFQDELGEVNNCLQ